MSNGRRVSTSSSSSGSSSPRLTAVDSSTALILVTDDQDNDSAPFEFADDDEDPEQLYPPHKAVTPLSPTTVLLYLLSPNLKLGALLLPNFVLPLKHGVLPLVCFAILSAFARQIWYMLARYLKKPDLEEIVLEAFARGRGKERRRAFLRTCVRSGTGCLRILLATLFLRRKHCL